jgi:hypothetical protein
MRVSTMGRIDFWAGVSLCVLATTFIRILRFLRPALSRPLSRVLFIGLSELGSTILARPAMLKARNQLSAQLFFHISNETSASIELTGLMSPSNVFKIRIDSLGPRNSDGMPIPNSNRRHPSLLGIPCQPWLTENYPSI